MKRSFSIALLVIFVSVFGLYAAFEDVADEPSSTTPPPATAQTVKTQKPAVPAPVAPTVKTQKPAVPTPKASVPQATIPAPVAVAPPSVPVPPVPAPLDINTLKFNKEISGWRYKNWDADLAEVSQSIKVVISAVKPLIDKLPAAQKIKVIGYTDGVGPENPEGEDHPGNIAIGEKRANAVVDYIVKNYGISRDRFEVSSKGGADLKFPGNVGAAANRRVVIKFEP